MGQPLPLTSQFPAMTSHFPVMYQQGLTTRLLVTALKSATQLPGLRLLPVTDQVSESVSQ